MSHIVLTEEQLQIVGEAGSSVEVVSPANEPLGCLTVFSAQERDAIARFKRSNGTRRPAISGEQVQAFLGKLHELADSEGIDEKKVDELLHRFQGGERA